MTEEKKIEINNCPLCGGKHIYKLKVERTFVLKAFTMNDLREKSHQVRVTRIFICPVKNEKFQATFKLYQASSSVIENVTVEGVLQDETEKQSRG